MASHRNMLALILVFLALTEVSAFLSTTPIGIQDQRLRTTRSVSARKSCLVMEAASQSRRDAVISAATCIAGISFSAMAANADEVTNKEMCEMTTTAGVMKFEFWPEVAPKTVENFKTLAKSGYFDGQAFHRIIKGFVIQGGDPNSKKGYGPTGTLEGADVNAVRKWGTGGPGYNIKAEFNPRKHEFGVLSMARSQNPDSAGSQFFVCLGNLPSLDNKYTTFGQLIDGAEVLRKLGEAQTVRGDYPTVRQGIESVKIFNSK